MLKEYTCKTLEAFNKRIADLIERVNIGSSDTMTIHLDIPSYRIMLTGLDKKGSATYYVNEYKKKYISSWNNDSSKRSIIYINTKVNSDFSILFEVKKIKKSRDEQICDVNVKKANKKPSAQEQKLAKINADLLEVLLYVAKKKCGTPFHESTEYKAEVKGNTAYYYMRTRIESYYRMSHMDATDDLLGSLECYEENLPTNLDGKVDEIFGEVGEKGYITIGVCKGIS